MFANGRFLTCDADPSCGSGSVYPGADDWCDGGDDPLEPGAEGDPARDGHVVALQRRVHHVQVDDVQLT